MTLHSAGKNIFSVKTMHKKVRFVVYTLKTCTFPCSIRTMIITLGWHKIQSSLAPWISSGETDWRILELITEVVELYITYQKA